METRQKVGREKMRRWRHLFDRCDQSGLSQKAFCKQHGIALSTFTYWRRRLNTQATNPPAFIPVRLQEDVARHAAGGAWACEIAGIRAKIRLRECPDAAAMRELISMAAGEAQ